MSEFTNYFFLYYGVVLGAAVLIIALAFVLTRLPIVGSKI